MAVGVTPLDPTDAETVALTLKLPANRLYVLMVTLKIAEPPGGTVRVWGLAVGKKFGDTFETRQAVTECISHPEKL